MNCRICQEESENYRGGKLPDDLRIQVERHLKECPECAAIYKMDSIADSVINQEKEISPAIDLTARIMDKIENADYYDNRFSLPFRRVLRPALVITSMAAAIFVGVLIGNIYKPAATSFSRPVELSLMDDAAIESIDILSNE
jgi:anti-sigma factor RsiW